MAANPVQRRQLMFEHARHGAPLSQTQTTCTHSNAGESAQTATQHRTPRITSQLFCQLVQLSFANPCDPTCESGCLKLHRTSLAAHCSKLSPCSRWPPAGHSRGAGQQSQHSSSISGAKRKRSVWSAHIAAAVACQEPLAVQTAILSLASCCTVRTHDSVNHCHAPGSAHSPSPSDPCLQAIGKHYSKTTL